MYSFADGGILNDPLTCVLHPPFLTLFTQRNKRFYLVVGININFFIFHSKKVSIFFCFEQVKKATNFRMNGNWGGIASRDFERGPMRDDHNDYDPSLDVINTIVSRFLDHKNLHFSFRLPHTPLQMLTNRKRKTISRGKSLLSCRSESKITITMTNKISSCLRRVQLRIEKNTCQADHQANMIAMFIHWH